MATDHLLPSKPDSTAYSNYELLRYVLPCLSSVWSIELALECIIFEDICQ